VSGDRSSHAVDRAAGRGRGADPRSAEAHSAGGDHSVRLRHGARGHGTPPRRYRWFRWCSAPTMCQGASACRRRSLLRIWRYSDLRKSDSPLILRRREAASRNRAQRRSLRPSFEDARRVDARRAPQDEVYYFQKCLTRCAHPRRARPSWPHTDLGIERPLPDPGAVAAVAARMSSRARTVGVAGRCAAR